MIVHGRVSNLAKQTGAAGFIKGSVTDPAIIGRSTSCQAIRLSTSSSCGCGKRGKSLWHSL